MTATLTPIFVPTTPRARIAIKHEVYKKRHYLSLRKEFLKQGEGGEEWRSFKGINIPADDNSLLEEFASLVKGCYKKKGDCSEILDLGRPDRRIYIGWKTLPVTSKSAEELEGFDIRQEFYHEETDTWRPTRKGAFFPKSEHLVDILKGIYKMAKAIMEV